jgi:pyruvate/2-oxoglutarate dehydrogenase complex dihydrolipoamide acyltransferase (E2) component
LQKIYVPRVDPALETAIIMWNKNEGDEVEKGEALLIVEGEKTTFEVESPIKGVLHKVFYPSGSEVPVGEVIGIVREPGEVIEE